MQATVLDHPVLVLNRLWQAVNICSVRRAFNLLLQGHAQVVHVPDAATTETTAADAGNPYFGTHDFASWTDLSRRSPEPVMLHGVSLAVRIPRVIVLLIFDRLPKKEIKFTRHNLFERDNDTCQYCGRVFDRKDLNLDHVLPRERGGQMTWENIVCSCIRCNTRKGNRLPHEAGMHLIRKPKRPRWRPFTHLSFGNGGSAQHHESWKHFVDVAYWNVELSD